MNIKKAIRLGSHRNFRIVEVIIKSMDLKPERHYFYDKEHAQPVRLMNMTGG